MGPVLQGGVLPPALAQPTHLALSLHPLGLGSAPPGCGTWRNLPWKLGVMGYCGGSGEHGARCPEGL